MVKTNKLLKEIEQKAKSELLPIVGRKKGKLLVELVKKYKPQNILEIGTLVGYSSILMSQHLSKTGKITTIEINPKAASIAKENFEKAGTKNVSLVLGDAMKAIQNLDGPFDFVFLDAEKDEYYNYLLLIENKLSQKAIVVADNVKLFEDELRDYIEYVKGSDNYKSETHEFGDDAMEVSFKKNY
ncbi:MAG: O-methyltransferase [Candidatus Staskawiczbacteria bacterium]|nr:O-methyltransferase [Candidatus Staskawiczbacteria bacterium]